MSPKARAAKFYRDLGYRVADWEMVIPKTFIKRDGFGFFDLLAFHPDEGCGVVGIQATTLSNISNRQKRVNDTIREWALSPYRRAILFAAGNYTRGKPHIIRLFEFTAEGWRPLALNLEQVPPHDPTAR